MRIIDNISSLFKKDPDRKLVILLIVIGFLVWGNTLHNTLLWDDDENIIHNAYVQNVSLWPKLFTKNQVVGAGVISNQYRPFLELTYGIEYHLWHLWPVGYHLVNLIIHISNAILLFFIVKKLLIGKLYHWKIAFFCFIIFSNPSPPDGGRRLCGGQDGSLGIVFYASRRLFIFAEKKYFLGNFILYPGSPI